MYIPRQVKDALPLDVSRKTIEEFAAKVRAQILLPNHSGSVEKMARALGGTINRAGTDRAEGMDDFFVAYAGRFVACVVDLSHIARWHDTVAVDTAKAIGHYMMHYKTHRVREGRAADRIGMVVQRYPKTNDINASDVNNEGHWFAWELIAPAHDVAKAYAGSHLTTDVDKIFDVARSLRVSENVVRIQIDRARQLGLIKEKALIA